MSNHVSISQTMEGGWGLLMQSETERCLTLGVSDDPVRTTSADWPGKSSRRQGLRLNTGFSLGEERRDPLPVLPVVMGGRAFSSLAVLL